MIGTCGHNIKQGLLLGIIQDDGIDYGTYCLQCAIKFASQNKIEESEVRDLLNIIIPTELTVTQRKSLHKEAYQSLVADQYKNTPPSYEFCIGFNAGYERRLKLPHV